VCARSFYNLNIGTPLKNLHLFISINHGRGASLYPICLSPPPPQLTSFRMLGYRECRCEGFSADSLSHNSRQLRVTAAAARSLTKIRKLHSHVQRQATSSSTTSLSLLFIQFSALEREREGGGETDGQTDRGQYGREFE